MKNAKRIRTVLYGDQRLSFAELELLHTPAMQRLYGLKQLGLTDRIFIDASHARIHHVVGVLEQVDKLVSAIAKNIGSVEKSLEIDSPNGACRLLSPKEIASMVRERKPVIRLIGLLHDLTHAPFGHTVEDEIQLVDTKHDEPDRQADAFYRLLCQLIAWISLETPGDRDRDSLPKWLKPFLSQGSRSKLPNPLELGRFARRLLSHGSTPIGAYWRLAAADLAELLAHMNCAMTALLHIETLHKMDVKEAQVPRKEGYEFQLAIRTALLNTGFEKLLAKFEFQPHRDAFMLDIVGNTVCADLLDYAKRDSHFSGLRLDYDPDRIAENFTLVSHDDPGYERENPDEEGNYEERKLPKGVADPFAGRCLRTAISLVSHKYRTDVPSELMNLLNVRFYLYERVIYHPTKCAAGSMLGTALQLLGWCSSVDKSQHRSLPDHLRFVGDEVFLHDIRAALDFILDWTASDGEHDRIDQGRIAQLANLDSVHSGLVSALLDLHTNRSVSEMRSDMSAARLLLDRLGARRYFRPVFRAFPDSRNEILRLGSGALAQKFQDPNVRYRAERNIEYEAKLPPGTITIHCPTRKTARKIANVLLTKPHPTEADKIYKLKHIGKIDPGTFGKHQEAVKAVERMYTSMWRLLVFVAPEHLSGYQEISDAVGRVISTTLSDSDIAKQFPWQNDPHLLWELERKSAFRSEKRDSNEEILAPFGALLQGVTKELLDTGRLDNIPSEFLAGVDALPPLRKVQLENALSSLLRADPSEGIYSSGEDRADRLLRAFKMYKKNVTREEAQGFMSNYSGRLALLPSGAFQSIVQSLEARIFETTELERRGGKHAHSGFKFDQLEKALNQELRKHGVSPPPDRRESTVI